MFLCPGIRLTEEEKKKRALKAREIEKANEERVQQLLKEFEMKEEK